SRCRSFPCCCLSCPSHDSSHAYTLSLHDALPISIDTYMPDLTIYLKLDPAEGLQRIKDNQRENNRLDEETIDFHKKVVLGYNKLSELYPNRIKVVDAAQPIDKVVRDRKSTRLNSSHVSISYAV